MSVQQPTDPPSSTGAGTYTYIHYPAEVTEENGRVIISMEAALVHKHWTTCRNLLNKKRVDEIRILEKGAIRYFMTRSEDPAPEKLKPGKIDMYKMR